MNRRELLASVPATLVLAASACSGTGGMTTAEILAFAQKVKDKVNEACGFLPELEGVLALLGTLPFVGTVESVANMVCGALKTPPLTYAKPRVGAPAQVVVNNVTINGKFTR